MLYDKSEDQVRAALSYVDANIDAELSKRGKERRVQITVSDRLAEAVKDSWMVIEAIPEKLDLKIDILGELDKLTREDCILATNSSSYKAGDMIKRVERRNRVCNTHYYIPPENTCVELMSCGHTDEAIFPFLIEETAAAGFNPIHVRKESSGLLFNRIWAAIKREALMVLEEGVGTPEDIDILFKDWFHAKNGPCQMMDAVGLDTVYNIEKHYIEERGGIDDAPLEWLKENYLDKGNLGNKSGKGLCHK